MINQNQHQAMRPPASYPQLRDSSLQFPVQNAQIPAQVSLPAQNAQFSQPYPPAPSNAVPTQPRNFRPVVTGHLYCHGKASDKYQGAQLHEILRRLDINMEAPPPFENITAYACYPNHGVVRINNIPFTVTAQEISQFVSRFTTTPPLKKHEQGWPIHIIMEKPTGKTMDCFVEFPSHEAARDCVKRFEYTAPTGRTTKIGNRNVSLDMSNQTELMQAVFPRARYAKFDELTGRPSIISHDEDPSWSVGFRGYFTMEELYGVTRFAETPTRSPFVNKCQQRVYESMISTLYKFPWAATQTYTIAARNALFVAAFSQLQVLSRKVDVTMFNSNQNNSPNSYNNNNNRPAPVEREVGLSQTLLLDLLFAGLNVPSFTLLQKHALCQIAGPLGDGVPLNRFAHSWTFQTLAPARNAPDDVIQFWVEIFNSGFHLISKEGTKTTYEDYLNVYLNKLNFPVAEWTLEGVELPFEDGARIEMAVMMVYINRGRAEWAKQRGLTVSKWEPTTLMDLMETIAREKEAGRHFEPGEPKLQNPSDNNVSPTTTEFVRDEFPVADSIRDAAAAGPSANSSLGSGNNAQIQASTSSSKLNPATAKDFVPISARKPSVTEPEPNNVYSVFKSIWSDPPVGAAQPTRVRFPTINTNVVNRDRDSNGNKCITRESLAEDIRLDSRMLMAFRDSFGPPTNETRGFKLDRRSSRVNFADAHAATNFIQPQSFFNPFQERGSIFNNYTTNTNTTPASAYSAANDRVLSLPTTAATMTRTNSADTALISTSTSNDPMTATTSASASSHRNSSFTIDDAGSPTPTRVQKYPNITYSNMIIAPPGLTHPSQVNFGQNQYQIDIGEPGPNQNAVTQALTQLESPFAKLRAQSTPFTGYQYGRSASFGAAEPHGLEKRGSLPVNVTGSGADDVATIQPQARARGGTVVEYDGDDGEGDGETGTGVAVSGGGDRLSASELWKQVRGY